MLNNRHVAGYVGFDLLFAFLAISAMLVFSMLAINQKTSSIGQYFSTGASDYSALMASDYVVKLGLGGNSAPSINTAGSGFHHHVFSMADSLVLSGITGAKPAGLSGYAAYLDNPPAGAANCVGRIAAVEDCLNPGGCAALPRRIFVCRDAP
ncbi:MAG: hypothetical protein WC506_02530 [Candidatus Micrarchaeia archaeon]